MLIALRGRLFDGDVRAHAMSLLLREREITFVFSFHARGLFMSGLPDLKRNSIFLL